VSADVQQFQVDLRGVVDLLSRHIYSSPRVYLRELMQNARDAITARREVDGGGGRIRITPLTAENATSSICPAATTSGSSASACSAASWSPTPS